MVMGGDNTIGINKKYAPSESVANFWLNEGVSYSASWASSSDGDFSWKSSHSNNKCYVKNGGMVCYNARTPQSAYIRMNGVALNKYKSVSFAAGVTARCGYGSSYEARGEAFVYLYGTDAGSLLLLGADINNGNHHGEPFYGIGATGYFTLSFDGDTMTVNTSTYETTSQSDGDGEDADDDGAVATIISDGTTQDISTWGDVFIQISCVSGGDSLNTYNCSGIVGVVTGTTGAVYGSKGTQP